MTKGMGAMWAGKSSIGAGFLHMQQSVYHLQLTAGAMAWGHMAESKEHPPTRDNPIGPACN